MQRSLLKLFALVWVCVGAAALRPAAAQDVVPSEAQLEILRNLTSEQREAILRQLGVRAGSLSARDRESDSERARRLEEEERLRALARTDEEDEELRGGVPVFRGEDSLIIEVDFLLPQSPVAGHALGNQTTLPVPPAAQWPPATTQQPQLSQQQQRQRDDEAREEIIEQLTLDERQRLENLITLIRSRNPYQLSRDGVLFLPGFAGIPLAGLNEQQAMLRLKVEPALSNLDIRVTRLPLRKSGPAALKPFGYDLFNRSPSTFAPVTNVPVPADYVVGPGDELEVQLYGNQNRNLLLTVGRDGQINFPELGPINVSGRRFNDVKEDIEARVERQMIGVRASVTMGDTRSIRVFVLGEANRPGSYTISGLGTITSALFAAGGVKPIGSLRKVQLKRQGSVVRELDLYDMLLRGDTSDDARLLPGDTIFIPPVGRTVTIDGEVRRPAIYEIKDETTVEQLIELAGGLSAEADLTKATLTRIDENRRRVVTPVELVSAAGRAQTLRDGDLFRVPRLRPTLDSGVQLKGHVHTPGVRPYFEGMRLSDVIHSVDEVMPNGDLNYVLIRRELPPDRRVSALSADLAAALQSPGSDADVLLMPRDQITVFDLQSGRDRIIRPLLDELRLQAQFGRPTEVVRISGRVRVPGEYPLEPGMTVSDLIRAGGSLEDAAYGGKAELTRYHVVNGETRHTELIEIDLAAVMRGDPAADIPLAPFDSLSIKEISEWGQQEVVTLLGEVRFPGQYAIKRGETLKSVLMRAGGLTEYAFPEGSIFTREDLRRRQQEQLDDLATRIQNDLVTLALQGVAANQGQAGAALSVGQSLLSQIRETKAVGRLAINLPRTLRSEVGGEGDIVLRDGDRLIVPRYQQEVTVIGEVQSATSHLYRPELTRDDYIALSGGITSKADASKIYVVRADGSVVARQGNRWFNRGDTQIRPGDTIVVPLDTERLPTLASWQAVTQIIYNLAVAAAAVASF